MAFDGLHRIARAVPGVVIVMLITGVPWGCSGGTSTLRENLVLPEWVAMPPDDAGFSATECVVASGNISIDRNEAMSKAQTIIAQQLQAKVEGLNESIQRITRDQDGDPSESTDTFTTRMTVVISTTVRNARVGRQDFAELEGRDHFCVYLALDEAEREALGASVVESAAEAVPDGALAPEDARGLYSAFMG